MKGSLFEMPSQCHLLPFPNPQPQPSVKTETPWLYLYSAQNAESQLIASILAIPSAQNAIPPEIYINPITPSQTGLSYVACVYSSTSPIYFLYNTCQYLISSDLFLFTCLMLSSLHITNQNFMRISNSVCFFHLWAQNSAWSIENTQ